MLTGLLLAARQNGFTSIRDGWVWLWLEVLHNDKSESSSSSSCDRVFAGLQQSTFFVWSDDTAAAAAVAAADDDEASERCWQSVLNAVDCSGLKSLSHWQLSTVSAFGIWLHVDVTSALVGSYCDKSSSAAALNEAISDFCKNRRTASCHRHKTTSNNSIARIIKHSSLHSCYCW